MADIVMASSSISSRWSTPPSPCCLSGDIVTAYVVMADIVMARRHRRAGRAACLLSAEDVGARRQRSAMGPLRADRQVVYIVMALCSYGLYSYGPILLRPI